MHRYVLLLVLMLCPLACAHPKRMAADDKQELFQDCDSFMQTMFDMCHDKLRQYGKSASSPSRSRR